MNELLLSKEIYPLTALKKTAAQFNNIAQINIKENTDNWKCDFELRKDIPLDMVISEFENYIIDLINSEKMYESN